MSHSFKVIEYLVFRLNHKEHTVKFLSIENSSLLLLIAISPERVKRVPSESTVLC